jgi:CHAT domain-containing protein
VLDRILLAPLRTALENRERIVIVPTARLFSVPWHALATLRDRLVSINPSATMWHRAALRPGRDGPAAVIAGPGLPGAAAEAARVADLYTGAITLMPPHSTNIAVSAVLSQARLAHVACHGTFRADNPSFSSLEMSDGPLTVLDLERIDRGPDLVVLASCDTGASEALPGEELRGFLTSLLMMGTKTIVASAVPVPDLDTASMMVAVHGQLCRGATVLEALHHARATRDLSTMEGLLTSLAFGCFGTGETTVGEGVDDSVGTTTCSAP